MACTGTTSNQWGELFKVHTFIIIVVDTLEELIFTFSLQRWNKHLITWKVKQVQSFFVVQKKPLHFFCTTKKVPSLIILCFFLISYLKKIISWSMLLVRLLWYICKLNRFVGLDFNAKLCLKHLHCTLKVSGCHQSYCAHLQLISTMFSLTWESKGSSFFTNFRNCSLVSLLSSPW